MNFIINSEDYKVLAKSIYKLILAELDNPEDIESVYPKLVIMYEFFRLIRGEAFINYREPTIGFQKEMYSMEDEILKKLQNIKKQIPRGSDKA